MNHSLFDTHGHLLPMALEQMSRRLLSPQQRLAVAEHLQKCPQCALALAEKVECGLLINPSPAFQESTLAKIKALPPAPSRQQRRRAFWAYTLRVTAAMCAALVLTFSITPWETPSFDFTPPDFSFADTIAVGIKSFSEKLFNLEVDNHD